MKSFLLLFFTLATTVCLPAQTFVEFPATTPFEGINAGSIAFADVDNDNDQDVLITGRNALSERISKLYTNDGAGNFSLVSGTPFDGVHLSSVAFADVDGDNDQDVLIAGRNGSNVRIAKLYTNNGDGNFTEVMGTPFAGVSDCSIAFADVDGDDDPDLLITGYGGTISFAPSAFLYINDGNGNFSEQMNTPFQGVEYSSVAFADVDSDNDQDLVIAGRVDINNAVAFLYINDGDGNFTEAADTPFEGVEFCSIAFGDVDGDDDQDLLITGQDNSDMPSTKLYANNGMGQFTEAPGIPFEGLTDSSVAFADVDGDNDQDLLITGVGPSGALSKLYANNGGTFSEVTGSPFESAFFSSVKFADIDGDDDLDVMITGSGSMFVPITKLYLNQGGPSSSNQVQASAGQPLAIYPNPTSSNRIDLHFSAPQDEQVDIRIVALNGSIQWTQRQKVHAGENHLALDISTLQRGIYSLEIRSDRVSALQMLVVD